jgi:ATP-dependent Clp protease ATP-binding subunit ClpB
MNLEKFTDRARGFLQAAQTIAQREDHQTLVPDHLLKALLDDEQGMAANLVSRAGGAPERVREALDLAMSKLPKVTGSGAQVYMDKQTAKVLDQAEALAKKAGDSFVAVERILTALAMVKSGAKDALDAGAVNAQALNAAIEDLRKGRTADSAGAEDSLCAEEICPRPHRCGARRQDRPDHRARRRNPPLNAGAKPPDQEQPRSHR